MSSTINQIHIEVSPEKVYNAFLDPALLTKFLVPHDMTAAISGFRSGLDGGYRMILRYPVDDSESKGKTTEKEDGYTAKFTTLEPYLKIVCIINFDTEDEAFQGAMTETITMHPRAGGTDVKILFENIPSGIDPKDNTDGTNSSLQKLKTLLEAKLKNIHPGEIL